MPIKAFYNDVDSYCCAWVSNLMDRGLITPGKIDDRKIEDLGPDDVARFERVHLFCGVAGWEFALNLAGWGEKRCWTGSCPCQPFSVAGKGKGAADERHLWPYFHRLIRAARPPVVMGEQVSGAAGYGWLDGVRADLEGEGYAVEPVDIPACGVGAPHIRNRLYWVADAVVKPEREPDHQVSSESRQDARIDAGGIEPRSDRLADRILPRLALGQEQIDERGVVRDQGEAVEQDGAGGFWSDYALVGPDPKGRFRRVKPGVRLLAHGVPARVSKLRALGNAIVPELAVEVIRAWMETEGRSLQHR